MGEAATAIEYANELKVPDPAKFHAVLSALGERGQGEFIQEILEALGTAQRTNDLRAVQFVLDAWFVSFRFGTMPKLQDAFANAAINVEHEKRYTVDEVAEYLGVA